MRAASGAFVERLKLVNAHVAGKAHGDDALTPDQAASVACQTVAEEIVVLMAQGAFKCDFRRSFDVRSGQRIVSRATGRRNLFLFRSAVDSFRLQGFIDFGLPEAQGGETGGS